LLNGFWILFSTHLGNTDMLARTLTDILWMGSPALRRWGKSDVGKVYYSLLIPFSLWVLIAVRLPPMTLFKVMGNMAGLIMVISSVQIFWVNRKFLPREIRVPWREWMLLACSLFYLFFLVQLFLGK
jgi:hypothetical protein